MFKRIRFTLMPCAGIGVFLPVSKSYLHQNHSSFDSRVVRVQSGQTIEGIANFTSLVRLRKSSYSYESYIDRILHQSNPKQIVTSANNRNMLRMVESGRADYFFIAPKEAEELIAHSGRPNDRFRIIHFSDAPPGNKRYILCGRGVDKETVRKMNEAIAEVVGPLN